MPVDSFLLDTSIATTAWDGRHESHSKVRERLKGLEQYIFVCVVTIAEVEYGLKTAPQIDGERQEQVRIAMAQYKPFPIDKHTAEAYSSIRAELFKTHSPRGQRKRLTVKRVSDLRERTTDKDLGIQENDLWITSVALQYNFVLLTSDKKMKPLLEMSRRIFCLRYEIWA